MSTPLSREQFVEQVLADRAERFPLVKIAPRRASRSRCSVNGARRVAGEPVPRRPCCTRTRLKHHIERWVVELLRAAEGTPDQAAIVRGAEGPHPADDPARDEDGSAPSPTIGDAAAGRGAERRLRDRQRPHDRLHPEAQLRAVGHDDRRAARDGHREPRRPQRGDAAPRGPGRGGAGQPDPVPDDGRLRRQPDAAADAARAAARAPRQPVRGRHPQPRHPPVLPQRRGDGRPPASSRSPRTTGRCRTR